MELLSSFTIFLFLGVNHRLPLFHMYNNFVYFHSIEERINEFSIAYIVNTILHVNKFLKNK